jgi:transcriptional regulator with GAF, ATPase, and Fis domain
MMNTRYTMNTAPSDAERESRLLRTFVHITHTLIDDYDVTEVPHRLVEFCVDVLGADAAGMLLSDQGRLSVVASSSARTHQVGLFQLDTDEGPCLACARTGEPVLVADIEAAHAHWPRFVGAAVERGFASVHAVPMRLRCDTIGALTMFGDRPGAMAEQEVRVAQALADIATVGILQQRTIRRGEVLTQQLQTALHTRITIEQAKGVLAQAGGLDMADAFAALRTYGRGHQARLVDVARRLVAGDLRPAEVLHGPATRFRSGVDRRTADLAHATRFVDRSHAGR